MVADELQELSDKATPGEWFIVGYGDGDSLAIHYDANNRVCFMATPGSHGAMDRIDADAALIAAMCSEPNRKAIIAALKAAETPLPDDMAGLVEKLRFELRDWNGKNRFAFKKVNALVIAEAADAITALTRQLAEAQQHAEALADGMDRAITFIEALADNDLDEPIADNGMTVGAKLQMDAPPLIFKLRAALAAYRSVKP